MHSDTCVVYDRVACQGRDDLMPASVCVCDSVWMTSCGWMVIQIGLEATAD